MTTVGVYLLYAAVVLRGVVVFNDAPQLPFVIGCFGGYGLLLVLAPWITGTRSKNQTNMASQRPRFSDIWRSSFYLSLQFVLVASLMVVPETQDFFALLFVPLSIQAVLSFGNRIGYIIIAVFSLFTIVVLLGAEDGPLFGLVMGIFFSGLSFLFGGYASQIKKAEAIRVRNQQTLQELQKAHSKLLAYSDQVAGLAVEKERNRLARDLHDSVTQTAFSMNLTAQSALLLLEKEPVRSLEQLVHLEGLAANALREIQALISHLKPRSMAEEGITDALQRLAVERQEREGLRVILNVNGDRYLSEAEVVGLYYIAYEALTNVIKHSTVREASIMLDLEQDNASMEIVDRGIGFEVQPVQDQQGHLGLAGMSERAVEIGWRLSIESQPQQGTRIRVVQIQPGVAK
jgi:signal transduction histidine kinase